MAMKMLHIVMLVLLCVMAMLLLTGCETVQHIRDRQKHPVVAPDAAYRRIYPSLIEGAPDIELHCYGTGVFRPCRRPEKIELVRQ